MTTEDFNEKELADLLDAYMEQAADAKNAGPGIANAALTADLLREDVQTTQATPAFVATLSAQLRDAHASRTMPVWQRITQTLTELFKPAKGKTMTRLTWGLTVLCSVVATLLVVLLTQPRKLTTRQILAEAAEATSRRSGMVEHIIVEIRLKNLAENTETAYILEEWQAIGAAMDGNLITTGRATAHYAAGDDALTRPLSWAYETWDKACFLDLQDYPNIYRDANTDAAGCVSVEQTVRLYIPGPIGQPAEASPQAWISRLQASGDPLVYQKDTFNEQLVYRLSEVREDATLTLYVDRESYLPVGFVAQTPNYVLTQSVRIYEVKPQDAFSSDPFAWPPATLADGFQALPRP